MERIKEKNNNHKNKTFYHVKTMMQINKKKLT